MPSFARTDSRLRAFDQLDKRRETENEKLLYTSVEESERANVGRRKKSETVG